jgi:two-component SAPR family response regulator
MAYIFHQTGRYKEAWEQYQLAAQLVKSSQWQRISLHIVIGQAALLLDLEEFDEAEKKYRGAINEPTDDRIWLDGAYLGLSEIARFRGSFDESLNWLREGKSLGGQVISDQRYKVQLAHIYFDMGQTALAMEHIKALVPLTNQKDSFSEEEILAYLLKARILHSEGKIEKAYENLSIALEGAARLGYDQFLVIAAKPCAEFLRQAYQTSQSPQLNALIKRVNTFTTGISVLDRETSPIEEPSLRLEIRALGGTEVRKEGELLPGSAWRSTRARALFFYIVDRQQVRKDDIGLDFWPDFSPGKISSNFHATLWRVRQALGGKDLIIFNDDSYSLHPAISVWYDVAEFENYLRQASDSTLAETERAEILRQALRLYRGDFLHDVFLEWADQRREELQNGYMDALVTLAGMEQAKEHFAEARELYAKALNIDPYRDHIHLAVMQCLVSAGSPSAAKAHFQDYKATLHRDLNAEPLPELQMFYEKLPV